MRLRLWGLNRYKVDSFMRKLERDCQYELRMLEVELEQLEEENESLLLNIREAEKKALIDNDGFWQFAKKRHDEIIHLLNNQVEFEKRRLIDHYATNNQHGIKTTKRGMPATQSEVKNMDESTSSLFIAVNQRYNLD
jgi:predicted RecB family nuclease